MMTDVVDNRPLRGPLRKRESHLWARDTDDWYVEPEWVSERLFELEKFEGAIWDSACGLGRIVASARYAGLIAHGSDVVVRTEQHLGPIDFLKCTKPWGPNIVSNPPFKHAEAFVKHALGLAERKVAMLLPANWVQGDKRSRWLEQTPLARVYFITPRPSMPPGAVVAAGGKPGNGTTDYCWMVWQRGRVGPADIRWLRRDA